MVILLIFELDPELPICEKKKRKGGLSNITTPPLINTLRGFYLE